MKIHIPGGRMTAPDPVLPPDTFVQEWLARLDAAQPAEVNRRVTALEAQQTTNAVALAALTQKIYNLEVRVSQTEDAVAELNTATNDLAARIDAILAKEANLDANTATELRAVRDRLQGLAADPQNPVPVDPGTGGGEPTPEPVPGDGSGDVVNPTPVDENGNPV